MKSERLPGKKRNGRAVKPAMIPAIQNVHRHWDSERRPTKTGPITGPNVVMPVIRPTTLPRFCASSKRSAYNPPATDIGALAPSPAKKRNVNSAVMLGLAPHSIVKSVNTRKE